MQTIEVETTCEATVTERWVLRVNNRTARILLREPYRVLDALADNELTAEVVSVENVSVEDEHDRDVTYTRLAAEG